MIEYILIQQVFWLVGWLLFVLFLRRTTLLSFSRFFLLATLLLGVFLPLVPRILPLTHSEGDIFFNLPILVVTPAKFWLFDENEYLRWLLYVVLILPVAVKLFFLVKHLYVIYQLKQRAIVRLQDSYYLATSIEVTSPFTFMKTIFWNDNWNLSAQEKQIILRHEKGHVHHRHSWDTIFLEILSCLFWFLPMVFLIKHELKQIHEYQSDAYTVSCFSKQAYGHVLLEQYFLQFGANPIITNFSNTFLKKRIIMMTKKKSPRYLGGVISALACMVFSAVYFTACAVEDGTGNLVEQESALIDTEIMKKADQMPEFPGGQNEMLKYVYTTVNYPELARDEGKEGMAVVRFVVTKDGAVANAKVVKSLSPEMDDEVLRVVNSMPKWTPGKHNGQHVNVYYNLPVMFKLE